MAADLARQAGIGLRGPHVRELLERRPPLGLLEVHAENYFSDGGIPAWVLEQVRSSYPLSLHGVGLSLGSADPLDRTHLARLRALVQRCQPALVSEHLCWNSIDGRHFSDLLPLPRTPPVVSHLAARIGQVQDALGRELLVENLASTLGFAADAMAEAQFVAEVAARAGCRLLLDLNNLWVAAHNHGFDPRQWLAALAPDQVGQYHLAGHVRRQWAHGELLLDSHDSAVAAPVWRLYESALARFGPRPTVIERDAELPELEVLLAEATRAQTLLQAAAATCGRSAGSPATVGGRRPLRPRPRIAALAALQRRFGAALDQGSVPPPGLAGPPEQAAGRFAVYRNNHRQASCAALADIYPVLQRVLGAACFEALARAYLAQQPRRSGNLLDWGGTLAPYLAGVAELAAWPYLADLARFEWSLHRLFHAERPAQAPLTLAELAALDGTALAALRLQPIAASELYESAWPVLRIWQANQAPDGAVPELALDDGGVKCLLARPGLQPEMLELGVGEWCFLRALQPACLATAVSAAACDPAFDLPATLARLVGRGLLAAA